MTYPRDDVRKAFEDRVLAAIPAVPVKIENLKFQQPKALWACTYIMYSGSKRAAIGTERRFDRHTGFCVVDIFVPEDQGSKPIYDTAGALEAALNAQEFTLTGSGYVVTLVAKLVNGPMANGYLAK